MEILFDITSSPGGGCAFVKRDFVVGMLLRIIFRMPAFSPAEIPEGEPQHRNAKDTSNDYPSDRASFQAGRLWWGWRDLWRSRRRCGYGFVRDRRRGRCSCWVRFGVSLGGIGIDPRGQPITDPDAVALIATCRVLFAAAVGTVGARGDDHVGVPHLVSILIWVMFVSRSAVVQDQMNADRCH